MHSLSPAGNPMPTIERFDSEGHETLPEHRRAMNAPMRPPRVVVADDECQCMACQAATGGEVSPSGNLPSMGESYFPAGYIETPFGK